MPEEDDKLPFRMSRPADMDEPPAPEPARVAGPANGVIIVASLAILLNCVGGFVLRNFVFPNQVPAGLNMSCGAFNLWRSDVPFLEACVTLLVYPLAIAGGIQMKRLRSYPLALTSALLVMMPCSVIFPIGLAIGIWALAVLGDDGVRKAFS
jgi:hypothetical protein